MGMYHGRVTAVMVLHLGYGRTDNVLHTSPPAIVYRSNSVFNRVVKQHRLAVCLLDHQGRTRPIADQAVEAVDFVRVGKLTIIHIYPLGVDLVGAEQTLAADNAHDYGSILFNVLGSITGTVAHVETAEATAADASVSGKKVIGNHRDPVGSISHWQGADCEERKSLHIGSYG